MFSYNGYNASNPTFSSDFWAPVLDTFNYWMELGDFRIGLLHCSFGCPPWGLDNQLNGVRP